MCWGRSGIAIRLDVLAKNDGGDDPFSVWKMILSSTTLLVSTPLSTARYESLLRTLSGFRARAHSCGWHARLYNQVQSSHCSWCSVVQS